MPVKTLIIGPTEVGKTSLLMRYSGLPFQESVASTVGIDFQVKELTWNGQEIKLQIWDTAGQERYRAITKAYYNGASGFVLVFSLTNRESFASLDEWIKLARENTDVDIPIVLAGNKSDQKDQRVVTYEEAEEYADSVGCEYFETSSKDYINVDEVFKALLRAIVMETEEPEEPEEPETMIPDTPEEFGKKPEKPNQEPTKKPEKPQKKPEPSTNLKESSSSMKDDRDKKPAKGEAEEDDGEETVKLAGGGCKHAHHHHHHGHQTCAC